LYKLTFWHWFLSEKLRKTEVRIKAIFKITIKDNKSTEFNRGQCDSGEGLSENVHKSRVKYHRLRNNRASILGILLRTYLQVDGGVF
jgi:hypothetical protein